MFFGRRYRHLVQGKSMKYILSVGPIWPDHFNLLVSSIIKLSFLFAQFFCRTKRWSFPITLRSHLCACWLAGDGVVKNFSFVVFNNFAIPPYLYYMYINRFLEMEYTKNSALEDEAVQLMYQNAGLFSIKPLFTESLWPKSMSLLY